MVCVTAEKGIFCFSLQKRYCPLRNPHDCVNEPLMTFFRQVTSSPRRRRRRRLRSGFYVEETSLLRKQ